MGRNPFEKKVGPEPRVAPPVETAPPGAPAVEPTLLEWAAIDLPAQVIIGGLKVGLFAHSAWTAWSTKRSQKPPTH